MGTSIIKKKNVYIPLPNMEGVYVMLDLVSAVWTQPHAALNTVLNSKRLQITPFLNYRRFGTERARVLKP